MPTSRPRIRHISASVRCSRSAPSSSTRPRTAAPCGSSPITASAVIDLPDPLSPITPSTSPAPAAIATSDRIGRPWMASERSEIASRLTAGPPSRVGPGSRLAKRPRGTRGSALTPARLAAPPSERRPEEAAASSGASEQIFPSPPHHPRRRRQGGAGTTPPRARGRRAATAGRARDRPHVRTRRSRGSIRSRSPSPIRLSPSTVRTIASPGNRASHGAIATSVWLSASIRPQDGVGGCAPSPT